MKVVFTGAEYYLSNYLNCLKVPLVCMIVIMLIHSCIVAGESYTEKTWKDTVIGKHPIAYIALCIFTSAYLFLVWR